MPWYVVEGFISRPHQSAFENFASGPHRSFSSIPIQARRHQKAIDQLFQTLTYEFQKNEELFARFQRNEELTEEEMTDLHNAVKPIFKENWTARQITTKKARQQLQEQAT